MNYNSVIFLLIFYYPPEVDGRVKIDPSEYPFFLFLPVFPFMDETKGKGGKQFAANIKSNLRAKVNRFRSFVDIFHPYRACRLIDICQLRNSFFPS